MALLEKLLKIRLLAFDMDGVLTNGKLLVMPGGEWIREMDIKDGFAIEAAVKSGFFVSVISGSASTPVKDRLLQLGVEHVQENACSKAAVLIQLMLEKSVRKEEVLYMGDDIPDLDVSDLVGVFACPSDAATEVKHRADFISSKPGGNGCVREVIEKTLRIQDKWFKNIKSTENLQ